MNQGALPARINKFNPLMVGDIAFPDPSDTPAGWRWYRRAGHSHPEPNAIWSVRLPRPSRHLGRSGDHRGRPDRRRAETTSAAPICTARSTAECRTLPPRKAFPSDIPMRFADSSHDRHRPPAADRARVREPPRAPGENIRERSRQKAKDQIPQSRRGSSDRQSIDDDHVWINSRLGQWLERRVDGNKGGAVSMATKPLDIVAQGRACRRHKNSGAAFRLKKRGDILSRPRRNAYSSQFVFQWQGFPSCAFHARKA